MGVAGAVVAAVSGVFVVVVAGEAGVDPGDVVGELGVRWSGREVLAGAGAAGVWVTVIVGAWPLS